ncbi:MAG: FtsW/RodA/SpoVE family cell cycle protein, partial [Anaerolineales bacterium]
LTTGDGTGQDEQTISPAVLLRRWDADLLWEHWLGTAIWLVLLALAHRYSARWVPNADPYLIPIAMSLAAWGNLTVWRLDTYFGLRQSLWAILAVGLLILGLRLPADLSFLRRYKYVWLTAGLLLTAATIILGTNPSGFGPRMWLGCCGVYFQPSEPLKVLLIIYLSAYLAGISGITAPKSSSSLRPPSLMPLVAPTLLMTSLAIILLVVQRDLGTATIFLFLYAAILYVTTGRKRVFLVAGLGLVVAGALGYALFDVVQLRIEAWLNPWLDPSGRSFQIVQSLLAIANGGVFGRGPGLGSPGVVPIAHSDFIYAAIVEETGLVGAVGLLLMLGLFAFRGLRIALLAPDRFRSYLAAGLTTYLVAQSVLIIGGNIRLLPLTGVTLPFVSYGGSSLLTSFASLLLLLLISEKAEDENMPVSKHASLFMQLAGFLFISLTGAALATGWWAFYRSPALLTRTDNPRRSIADRYVHRGAILDRKNQVISSSSGAPGAFKRSIRYPDLSPIVGYTQPAYGQAGLEASLDGYLRGVRANPTLTIWWNHLLYGQPPPGLDVRTTLDIELQALVDQSLGDHQGAAVLLNASTGEILAMASHPVFDANRLDETWDELIQDERSPLLNRAVLGRYDASELLSQLFPEGTAALALDQARLSYLPYGETPAVDGQPPVLSPLDVALASAALSNHGIRPAPVLVGAVDTPSQGWVLLPQSSKAVQVLPMDTADARAASLRWDSEDLWEFSTGEETSKESPVSWYVGGVLPSDSRLPLALAVAIEDGSQQDAEKVGRAILTGTLR